MTARKDVSMLLKDLQAYKDGDVHTVLVRLLTAIDSVYASEWCDTLPAQMEVKRGAAKQIKELIRSLNGAQGIPLI